MYTLSIIGAGRVAQSLAYLFSKTKTFQIQDICSRSLESALRASNFINAGSPTSSLESIQAVDVLLIATPDDSIKAVAEHASRTINAKHVFHCSGVHNSNLLASFKGNGSTVASIHPLKSFADPNIAIQDFQGTWCAIEGDIQAIEVLSEAFKRIGAKPFSIMKEAKTLYHCASSMISNHTIGLMETAYQLYEQAGIGREQAMAMSEPLIRLTIENVFRTGTKHALTGPIKRGDTETVKKHIKAICEYNPQALSAYRALGMQLIELSEHESKDHIVDLLK